MLWKVLQSQSQVLKSLTLRHSFLVHLFPYANGAYNPNAAIDNARNTVANVQPKIGFFLHPNTVILAVAKSNSWHRATIAKYNAGK